MRASCYDKGKGRVRIFADTMPMSEKEYTPILPYDATITDNFTIYYPVAYTRNLNLVPPEAIAMESGNVVKYYRCAEKDPVPIGGK